MDYYPNLLSVETWTALQKAGGKISGFSKSQRTTASRIKPGDVFLCYLVGLGRWCGALEVESEAFEDDTPVFRSAGDLFVVRFRVKPIAVLDHETAIPVRTGLCMTRAKHRGQ